MKPSFAMCVVLTAFSAIACSSDDKGAKDDVDSGPGSGGASSGGGRGGASTGGASTGGASTGGRGGASTGGASTGGASTGGASNGGASTGGGANDASAPDGAMDATAADSGPGASCIWLDITNPDQCNKGVQIKNSCPVGRVPSQLTRCSDGTNFSPDTGYQEYTIAACPDTGCATDGNHTVWRRIECCYPVAGGDAGDAGDSG